MDRMLLLLPELLLPGQLLSAVCSGVVIVVAVVRWIGHG
jgi:hypothetical protein